MKTRLTTKLAKATAVVMTATGLSAAVTALLSSPAGASIVNGGPAHNSFFNLVSSLHVL